MVRAILVFSLVACGNAAPAPLAPTPAPPPPAPAPVAKPAPFSGIWLGTLQAGGKGLRIQLHLDVARTPASCSLDSLDQGAMGIVCDHVVASATELAFEVPAVQGGLKGTLSADANTVDATWTQGGGSLPLVLTRQASAIEAAKPAFDPPPPIGSCIRRFWRDRR